MNEFTVPKEMHITLFHAGQDWEDVDWYETDEDDDGDSIVHHLSYFRQFKENKGCPSPSNEMWQKFFNELERIDVFSWKSKKVPDVSKGLTDLSPRIWEIQILYQDGSIFYASGDANELPPRFEEFCEAVTELLSGHMFGAD